MSAKRASDNAATTKLITRVAKRLASVDGIVAVALGGSLARGNAHPDSDIDLGLYYTGERPPAIDALVELATELDDHHAPAAVTGLGEWGPWVNGGAWLQIEGRRVDWLYRDIERVARVIAQCLAGRPTCDYQVGHPHGFHNHTYAGEVHHAEVLHDRRGVLHDLRTLTTPYPPLLRRALMEKYLFEADFALWSSQKGAARTDVMYVSGNLFRSVACLVQVLFALNEEYCLNEKGAIALTDTFDHCPGDFRDVATAVLARPGATPPELRASLDQLKYLIAAVRTLCEQPLRELPLIPEP